MQRLTTLSTVLLSLFGYAAQSNPLSNAKVNFYEALVYVKIGLIILILIWSFVSSAGSTEEEKKKSHWQNNLFFYLLFIVQILETVVNVRMLVNYFCYDRPQENIKKGITLKLRPHEW